MEVAAGGTGGGPVRSRVRLNIALYVLVIVLTVAVCFIFRSVMWNAHADKGGDTSGSWVGRTVNVLLDRQSEGATSRIGTDVGPGLVQAVRPADEEDQERWNAVLDAATGMAEAFLNIDYKDLETTREAVLSRATGAFKKQYEKSFDGLSTLTKRAKSVQTGEVVWAGISSVDDDSATVFVATDGTVVNRTVETPQGRPYRIQMQLSRDGEEWLVRDLRFIEVEAVPEDGTGQDGNGRGKDRSGTKEGDR